MSEKNFRIEREFCTQLNKTVFSCKNVRTPAGTATTFIVALHPTKWLIVARFRNTTQTVTYLDVTSSAQPQKDKLSDLTRTSEPKRPQHIATRTQHLALAQTKESEADQQKELMYEMYQRRHRLIKSPLNFFYERIQAERIFRMGESWCSSLIPRNPIAPNAICYDCYLLSHIAPQCTSPMRHLHKTISNYEALTHKHRGMVPEALYWRVRRLGQVLKTDLPETTNPVQRKGCLSMYRAGI